MCAGAQYGPKHVQPEPPGPEATAWLSVPVEDEDGAEYVEAEEVEEEEHAESLNDLSEGGEGGGHDGAANLENVTRGRSQEAWDAVANQDAQCIAVRVRTVERPCSEKEIEVKICGLDVYVHGVEFLGVRRETERQKENITFHVLRFLSRPVDLRA